MEWNGSTVLKSGMGFIHSMVPELSVCTQCHTHRGVHPYLYVGPREPIWDEDSKKRLLAGIEKGRKEGYITKG